MTSTPRGDQPFDADGHPSVEAISEYAEEVLHPEQVEPIRAHLDDCAPCADTRQALDEIRTLLGSTPGERMPAEVAGRIDAALAAESLLASELPGIDPEELGELHALTDPDDTVARLVAAEEARAAQEAELPVDPAWTEAKLRAGLPEDATAPRPTPVAPTTSEADEPAQASDAAGPTEPAGEAESPAARRTPVSRRRPEAPSPSSGPAPGAGSTRTRRPRGVRSRAKLLMGAAAVAAAAVLGTVLSTTLSGGPAVSPTTAGPAHSNASPASPGGETVFTASGLPSQVDQLLGKSSPSKGAMLPHTAQGGPPSCVTSATGRTGTPLATEPGSYQGQRVYAVLYPAASAPAKSVDVYLVPADCSGAALLHQTVARP